MIKYFLFISLLHSCLLVQSQIKPINIQGFGDKSSCACDSLWKKPDVLEFTQLLERVTSIAKPVWTNYRLTDATFVIDAGRAPNGEYCLGLWRNGKAVSYAQLNETLQLLTPLYSYYLKYKELDTLPNEAYFKTDQNAPGFRKWMQSMNVSSAVYMPMDFSRLPFKMPVLTKVQLAMHEAFHIEVMLKYWYTGKGQWPKWDKQPDRKEVQICYTHEDSDRLLIKKELSVLADMIEALLEKNKMKACSLGHEFLEAREKRYDKLKTVTTKLADNSDGECRTAEALFELEEGLADYGSWTFLYNMGIANKADLLKRYRAFQKDHFYLSGCMLMHAITLMSTETSEEIIDKIVNATTVHDGALLTLFELQLKEYSSR